MRYVFMVIGATICGILGCGGGAYLSFEFMWNPDDVGNNLMIFGVMASVGAVLGTPLGGGIGFLVGRGTETLLREDGFEIPE